MNRRIIKVYRNDSDLFAGVTSKRQNMSVPAQIMLCRQSNQLAISQDFLSGS